MRAFPRIASAWACGFLFCLSAYADVVDGWPAFSSSSHGVYVWRTSAGEWQLRLRAGSGSDAISFSGSFYSGAGITKVVPVDLENDDPLSFIDSRTIRVAFNAISGNQDGARFFNSGPSLCLRSLNESPVTVYLGRSSVPAATPVDLTGDGACAVVQSSVVITDTGDGKRQVRLQPQGVKETFSGAVESTQPAISFTKVGLESHDSVYLDSPSKLSMTMTAWPNSVDGVDFTVPIGTGVCLRSAGDARVSIQLRSSLAGTVVLTTPADLTNSGACDVLSLSTSARKFHPGHYIFMLKNPSTQQAMSESIYPGVQGILKRFTWRELEPTEGNYDFSVVASDLDFVGSLGKQFIVMIEDKTFAGGENPLPDYLKHLAAPNNAGAYTAVRWDPYLVSRLNALTYALGQRFDMHPAFEGIALQESSLSLSSETLDRFSYTPEKYRDALIDMLKNAAKNMPRSQVFWYQSYIARNNKYIGEVAAAVKDDGVAMGGPDNMPDSVPLTTHSYPYYEQFKGQMPLFIQVEGVNYRHEHVDTSYPTKYWTMPELFAFGRDYLHVNYFFWVRILNSEYPDSYNVTHALPVIEENPVFNPWSAPLP